MQLRGCRGRGRGPAADAGGDTAAPDRPAECRAPREAGKEMGLSVRPRSSGSLYAVHACVTTGDPRRLLRDDPGSPPGLHAGCPHPVTVTPDLEQKLLDILLARLYFDAVALRDGREVKTVHGQGRGKEGRGKEGRGKGGEVGLARGQRSGCPRVPLSRRRDQDDLGPVLWAERAGEDGPPL